MRKTELRRVGSLSAESVAYVGSFGDPPAPLVHPEITNWLFIDGPNLIAVETERPTVWRYLSEGVTIYRLIPGRTRVVRTEGITLEPLGISPEAAADIRAQAGELGEDWDDPGMSVYDDA